MGNEDRVEIEHMGVVSLNLCTGHVLNLNNTIYVPSMRSNLIYFLIFLVLYSILRIVLNLFVFKIYAVLDL